MAWRTAVLILASAGLWTATQPASAAMAAEPPGGRHIPAGANPSPRPAVPVRYRASAPMPRTYPVPVETIRYRPLQRIHDLVRPELFSYFDIYLYVNKAAQGASAQRMYIFERLPNGKFHLRRRWPASTGRERQERYFTTTPTGVYKLDPNRFHERWISKVWDGVPMPYAMFLDVAFGNGRRSGIAIHGTHSFKHLGSRASGGCIRLAMENARELFYVIQNYYSGSVPKFAWDDATGHTSRTGELRRNGDGEIVMEHGYRVLLIVDNLRDMPGESAQLDGAPANVP